MKKFHNCNRGGSIVGRLFAWSAVLAAFLSITNLQAQISVTSLGSSADPFDAIPPASSWSHFSIAGGSGTPEDDAGLDTLVQAVAASSITAAVESNTGDPPGISANARWSSTGFYLQTRPTGNAATLLMATLHNDSGGDITAMNINYELVIRNAPAAELIPGNRVYYSLSGAASSWVPLGNFALPPGGPQDIPLDLASTPWLGGSTMYILFADDNSGPNDDAANGIDNFAITGVVGGTTTCVAITNQSQSITVAERGVATFSIMATGTPQMIQWYRDGTTIPGANSANYTIASAAYPGDNGAQFQATVINSLCAATSSVVTLTVNADTNPPTVLSAIGELDPTQIRVTFSEPIPDTGPGGYVGNFVVFPTGGDPNGAEALLTLDAALSPDGQTVTLTTDPRMAGVNYSVQIITVFDASSQQNPMPDTIIPFIQHVIVPIPADGTHEFHYYELGNLDGTGWETPGFDDTAWLTGMNVFTQTGGEGLHAAFGGTVGSAVLTPINAGGPNTVYFRTHFTLPTAPANAVVRLTNVIDDGAVFYVNGMDVGRVRMAAGAVTFDQQANANPGEPVAPDGFIIPASALVAGDNLLAIEVHQNGNSSDVVMGVRVETIINAFSTGQPSIIVEPQSQTVNEGGTVTLSVAADGAVPLSYQWRKGGVDIAGANNASYTINPVAPNDAGNYSVFVSNSLGTMNSAVAILTVITDTTPPAFLSALADTNLTNITLVFSERLDTANAQNVSHYDVHLTAGGGTLTIQSALLVNGTNVILTTSPRAQSQDYTIVLTGVTDAAVAQNQATPSSRAVRASIVILAPDDTTLWRFNTASNNLDGTGWQLSGYNDSAWLTALAGFTTTNNLEITTNGFELRTTNMLSPATGGPLTAYYRVPFNFPGSTANAALHIVGVIDDGLVAYINGVEAGRLRITNTSPVSFIDMASAGSPETTDVHLPLETITLTNLSSLLSGANLLAIELHQTSGSSDAVLSVQLVADIEQFGGGGPRLNVSRNLITGQVTLSWSGSGTLQQATVLPSGGAGWTDVPGNPPSPYTFTLTGTQGFFRLR